MKATLLPLAAVLGIGLATPQGSANAITKRGDPPCTTPDAENVPARNDCLGILSDWLHEKDNKAQGPLPNGVWAPVVCSEQCKIAVKADGDGVMLEPGSLIHATQDVLSRCSLDDDYKNIPFKGESSGEGFRVSVYKGGNCDKGVYV